MITSVRNPKIRWVRSLVARPRARREAQAFVIEGVRLAEEALSAGWEAQLVLYSRELGSRGLKVVEQYVEKGIQVEEVTPAALRGVSDTDTPPGILLVLSIQHTPILPQADFLLILDGLRDPGNLGTILRSAAAAGVQAALLTPGTTDAFAPKVVRSAMGAHFRIPLHSLTWQEIGAYVAQVRSQGDFHVYLADATEGEVYTKADFHSPLAIILGGEAEGAVSEAYEIADGHIHIPMPGGTESLNVAVAATVLLFEVVRQRGNP